MNNCEKKSITWVQLCDTEWLVVCVNYFFNISFSSERNLRSNGICIQQDGVVATTSYYTWKCYRVWKQNTFSDDDKKMVEDIINYEEEKYDNEKK